MPIALAAVARSTSLGADLERLRLHYLEESKRPRAESRRMAEESVAAVKCAESCAKWFKQLQRQTKQ